LRLLYGYMWAHPGKKLLFMGGELGQAREWSHDTSLDWPLLERPLNQRLRRWLQDLNRCYREEPALYQIDFEPGGFQWIDAQDWEKSVISFVRRGRDPADCLLVVCNFTPVERTNYRVGVPCGGWWREILNSDAELYGGSGWGNLGGLEAAPVPQHGQYHSLPLTLPPLGVVYLKPAGGG
ncbi:MAG TPA: alpha amylase C-terminal domain-containing protein, partial [Nitrococcus sp.]|nr:alpha amylase C-terminal domain-containing protein [Nitrococcus sp.]